MKIGVISDTHIPERALDIPQEILDNLREVDLIIHAGDLCDLKVLDKLKQVCADVKAVWGNMDSEEIRAKLPQKEIITIGNCKIGVMHGWGHPDNLPRLMIKEFKDQGVQVVIFGHSHRPFNEKREGVLYFNPGSPTDRVFSPYNSYGILEINDKIEARIIKL